MVKELKIALDNHLKLLSMISDKLIPLKTVLINDTIEMKKILEESNKQRKENKNGIF